MESFGTVETGNKLRAAHRGDLATPAKRLCPVKLRIRCEPSDIVSYATSWRAILGENVAGVLTKAFRRSADCIPVSTFFTLHSIAASRVTSASSVLGMGAEPANRPDCCNPGHLLNTPIVCSCSG